MKKQFEDLHAMAERRHGAFKGDVNIQANKDVQFKIIKRVMFSCATARLQQHQLRGAPRLRGRRRPEDRLEP